MTRHTIAAALLALAAALAVPSPRPASAAPIPVGSAVQTVTIRGNALEFHTYRPSGCSNPTLLVVFHGSGRNGASYRDGARTLANNKCFLVVTPEFDAERFVGPTYYQYGGLATNSGSVFPYAEWTVHYVPEIVAWARANENRPTMPFFLWGHSAGGQFMSRVAGTNVAPGALRYVVGAPSTNFLASLGSHPNPYDRMPYGYTGMAAAQSPAALQRTYLALPLTIVVGLQDNVQDEDLSMAAGAVAQGDNRLARAQYAFNLGRNIAQANGWTFNWRIAYPDCGHSNSCLLSSPEASEVFTATPTPPAVQTPCGALQ